jgi:hypothetical protein
MALAKAQTLADDYPGVPARLAGYVGISGPSFRIASCQEAQPLDLSYRSAYGLQPRGQGFGSSTFRQAQEVAER